MMIADQIQRLKVALGAPRLEVLDAHVLARFVNYSFLGSAQESDSLPERPAFQIGGLWLI